MEADFESLYSTVRDKTAGLLERASGLVSMEEEGLYNHDLGDMSEEELYELKNERLRYTVEYAWENSDFYRELMEEEGLEPADFETVEDLEKLPVVEGEDILENQPPQTREYWFKNERANTRRPFNTSGSTGQPKTVFYSYDEMERTYDDVRRGLEHLGVEEGDKAVNYFPFVGLNISCMGNEGGMEELNIETIPISNTPFPTDVEAGILRSHAPRSDDTSYVMLGLPSHVDSKGKDLKNQGMSPEEFGIDTIILAGEPVSENRKEHIAETYQADVYEFLGSTEAGASAYECVERSGKLHLMEDSVHHEVLDPESREPVETGKEGELVVSRLLHPGEESSMPLLRYNLGDLVTIHEQDGECGCKLGGGRLIETPKRDEWSFILGAVNVDPVYFEDSIFSHEELKEEVREFQLQVDYDEETGRDVLDVLLEPDSEELAGRVYEDVARQEQPSDSLEELGNMFLDGNSHLHDTVDTVGAAEINIKLVDEIETGKGKPDRFVDLRD
ncbi:MAG: AMP-binding protein [Candidatus Nanohaloarchaea archaeon]|nr:AMP-binding protein [Candidatus Nanohaloarchaea archaeon]